jgi:NADH-quinone oxidoreductase subunit C
LSAPADVVKALDELGVTVPAPTEHPFSGALEVRWVAPERIAEACRVLRDADYFFESLTCVDRLEAHGVFELVYTFNRWGLPSRVACRVWAPKDRSVPTVSGVFGGADWNEREAWEFYGITFAGHPNLTWLLLPEGTEFRPLLKSFTAPPPSTYDDSLAGAPDEGRSSAGTTVAPSARSGPDAGATAPSADAQEPPRH